jgi:hypothetical protein
MSSSRLFAARFALALFAALAPAVACADSFLARGQGWMTYVNDRFGMKIDYLARVFAPENPPDNGDGRTFTSKDARVEIYASQNVDRDTPASFRARMEETEGYEDVTYSPSGDTWLVVSGFRGETIYYEKYVFRGGLIFAFGVDFPKKRKPFYSPIVERMENSFRPGRSN